MRKVLTAISLAATLTLPTACGSGHPAWCGQTITVRKAGGTPVNLGPYGWTTIGYAHLTVPQDFPALIRRDARQYNRSHDMFIALALGEVWKNDYQKECQ